MGVGAVRFHLHFRRGNAQIRRRRGPSQPSWFRRAHGVDGGGGCCGLGAGTSALAATPCAALHLAGVGSAVSENESRSGCSTCRVYNCTCPPPPPWVFTGEPLRLARARRFLVPAVISSANSSCSTGCYVGSSSAGPAEKPADDRNRVPNGCLFSSGQSPRL